MVTACFQKVPKSHDNVLLSYHYCDEMACGTHCSACRSLCTVHDKQHVLQIEADLATSTHLIATLA